MQAGGVGVGRDCSRVPVDAAGEAVQLAVDDQDPYGGDDGGGGSDDGGNGGQLLNHAPDDSTERCSDDAEGQR